MNRLQNLSLQVKQQKFKQLKQFSKICPQEIKSIVFGTHYHYIEEIYKIIQDNLHMFKHADIQDHTRKTQRYNSTKQMLKILTTYQIKDLKHESFKFIFGFYALLTFSLGFATKTNIQYLLYIKTLMTYATNQKHQQFIAKAYSLEHLGCFALTQLHHGSYTKQIATTANYNHQKQIFVLSTNGNAGMKFWIGALSQLANMAIIWAQVIVKGVSYGPHPFVVQIRDFKTHDVLPGIIIGDCGDKFGLNQIDNGYMILENLVVPKQNLLDALGGIDSNGNYVSKIKSNQKRFGLHMSPLSSGRASLAFSSLGNSTIALAIASKYVSQRRQFSNPNNQANGQILLIDYPLTKFRLIPLIAQTFVYFISAIFIASKYIQYMDIFTDPNNTLVNQLHAISAVLKPKASWFANKATTECRQLLGGHGYSSFSRIGRLFSDNDVQTTWQGDNNLLLQQTSKFLLKTVLTQTKCSLISLDYLWEGKQLQIDFNNINCLDNLFNMIKKIFLQRFEQVRDKMTQLKSKELGLWQQWNRSQPYYCNQLTLSFGDYIYFTKAAEKLTEIKHKQTHQFLKKSLILWSLRVIQGARFRNIVFRSKVQQRILQLCNQLTADSLKFIDCISPPDFIIDSPFVKQQPMKQYLNLFMTGNSTFKRVDWYQTLIDLKNNSKIN